MNVRQALLLVEGSIDFNQGVLSPTFLSFLTQWCAFYALGDRSVEPLSTRSRPISPASAYLRQYLFPLVLSLSPCLDALAATILVSPKLMSDARRKL
jgi:hypothetical protein